MGISMSELRRRRKLNALWPLAWKTDRVRTTCLGFGDNYVEDLLRQLAKCSGGDFYDADSPEKLPAIFREELHGLQQISAQNVRVRLKPLDFCEALGQLSDYPVTPLPDRRMELAIGDLISEEDRVLVLLAMALPLPLIDGRSRRVVGGRKFLELEVLWDEIGDQEIKSCRHEQIVRISGTQKPDEITTQRGKRVAWIAVQRAGKALDEATKAVDADKVDEAKGKLRQALSHCDAINSTPRPPMAWRVLEEFLGRIEREGGLTARSRKFVIVFQRLLFAPQQQKGVDRVLPRRRQPSQPARLLKNRWSRRRTIRLSLRRHRKYKGDHHPPPEESALCLSGSC